MGAAALWRCVFLTAAPVEGARVGVARTSKVCPSPDNVLFDILGGSQSEARAAEAGCLARRPKPCIRKARCSHVRLMLLVANL